MVCPPFLAHPRLDDPGIGAGASDGATEDSALGTGGIGDAG